MFEVCVFCASLCGSAQLGNVLPSPGVCFRVRTLGWQASTWGVKFKEALPVGIPRHLACLTLVFALLIHEAVLKHTLKFVIVPQYISHV